MAPITLKELLQVHMMDRVLFQCLLFKFGRSPYESLLIMSLWLWLEQNGYTMIISKLVNFSNLGFINDVANEALSCLQCLEYENVHIPIGGGLPKTSSLIQRQISLHLFIMNRFTVVAGIKNALNNICSRIFTDILYKLLCCGSSSKSKRTSIPWPTPFTPMLIPGFPHPLFGSFIIPPIDFVELELCDPRIWTKGPFDNVMDHDKTMFLTFSRGFHVTEEEVRRHFISTYGNCIKILSMGNPDASNQILYAVLILKKVEMVDQILRGRTIAKFRVNGKHIWARKYELRGY